MKKSKFFELFTSFTKKQIQELSLMIEKNDDEQLITLCKHLNDFIKGKMNDDVISRDYILKIVFKNTIDEKKLQKILNDGVKHCESLIIKYGVESDNHLQNLLLANYYQKQQLDKYFNQQIQTAKETITTNKIDSNTFYYKYRFEHLSVNHELKSNLRKSNYTDLSTYLHTYYETEQLKLKCVSYINLHDDLQHLPNSSVLFLQYQNCYTLLLSESEEDYIRFWNVLQAVVSEIDTEELKTIVNIFYNVCITQLNKNNSNYYEHLWNAYVFSLDNQIALEENGLLLPSHYKNIVTISLRLNKIDYALAFAEKYKSYLPEEHKNDVYNYNRAHIFFYQKQYDDVLMLLVQSKFTDVFYKLSSRVLQIKTYVELSLLDHQYDDVLDSSMNALKKYIYTNKEINELYASNYKNFYKALNKIISATPKTSENLIEEIKKIKPLPELEWLLMLIQKSKKA